MKAEIVGDNLVITMPIKLEDSSTGKTRLVCSSRGNVTTSAVIDGESVVVGVNAYIRKSKNASK